MKEIYCRLQLINFARRSSSSTYKSKESSDYPCDRLICVDYLRRDDDHSVDILASQLFGRGELHSYASAGEQIIAVTRGLVETRLLVTSVKESDILYRAVDPALPCGCVLRESTTLVIYYLNGCTSLVTLRFGNRPVAMQARLFMNEVSVPVSNAKKRLELTI